MNVELDRRVKDLLGQVSNLTTETQAMHKHIEELDVLIKNKDHSIKILEGERQELGD
jgi:hypothetical protein